MRRTGPTPRNDAGAPQPERLFCLITGDEIVNTLFKNEKKNFKKENQKEKPKITPLPSPSAVRPRAKTRRALLESTVT